MTERLQKWLASRGLGSRREIESWISAGRISVDGRVAELGLKVSGEETILVDGRQIEGASEVAHQALIMNKAAGLICTRRDPEGRPSVFDELPRLKGQRWISVGRLDLQTAGLLIFTTDGELAARLMHPSSQLEREYALRIEGELAPEVLEQLRRGIQLDDGPARCLRIEPAGGEGRNRWYRMVLQEGRNRIVRRLMEAVGTRVNRLIRVRYGAVLLPRDLPAGEFRRLSGSPLASTYAAAGLPRPRRQAPPQTAPRGSRRRTRR